MSDALSCIPVIPLMHRITEDDLLGDAFTKMNTNFCKADSELNKLHAVGDFKYAYIDDDHSGWKIVNSGRDLPKELYPQLECLFKEGAICQVDSFTYRLPTIPPKQVVCNNVIKTLNSFLYVGPPKITFVASPAKCFVPYDLEDGDLDCSVLSEL